MSARIEWHGDQLEREIKALVERKLKLAAQETADHVKEKISEGRRGSVGTGGYGAGTPPHVDTGRLRQSVFWTLTAPNVAIVGTPLLYGLYQEIGANIRPKKGKYLAIPWSSEAKRHSQQGGGAKTFQPPSGKKLKVIGRSKSTLLLVEETPGRGKARTGARTIIHYILTTHVTLPARPYLRPSLDEMRPRIQEIFSAA